MIFVFYSVMNTKLKSILMISEDHVTLKTNDAGNTDLITEIHYIVKYIKIGNQY